MKPVFNPFTGQLDWIDPNVVETDPVFSAWLLLFEAVFDLANNALLNADGSPIMTWAAGGGVPGGPDVYEFDIVGNLVVEGDVSGANVTSGEDPGHTHSAASITESDPVFSAWLEAGNDCPTMVDVSAATVAEGNNSLSITYDKVLIKWLKVTTASTDWTLTLYAKDDYATGPMVVVSGRSGDLNLYLDLPYADADETNELHYNFASASGSETHDIQILGYKLK